MKQYLQETPLLNFHHPLLQKLIADKKWRQLDDQAQILAIYNFVRDDIQFGFNTDDAISASQILSDGYGQCNTKAILFMALLRAVDVPCRLHGFTIDKSLQEGVMTGELYKAMPNEIVHTWTELYFNHKWYNMEGLILDIPYLTGLQNKFNQAEGDFSGYAVATSDLQNPQVYWHGDNDTYIQKEGIVQDFGVFDDPDTFFSKHAQNLSEPQKQLFATSLRHEINQNIEQIRELNDSN